MTGCRIGRIRPKSGGEIYRLPVPERDECQKELVAAAVATAALFDPGKIDGYVVFAWGNAGHTAVSYFVDDKSTIRMRLLPSWVADAIRAKAIDAGDLS